MTNAEQIRIQAMDLAIRAMTSQTARLSTEALVDNAMRIEAFLRGPVAPVAHSEVA